MRATPAIFAFALALAALTARAAQPTKRPTDAERGEQLYRRHCVACHGVRNAGDGPATAALVRPVPDLAGTTSASEEMVRVVLKGNGAMPGYEATFDRPDAVRVLKFMADLGPGKALTDPPVKGKPAEKPKEPVNEPPDDDVQGG
jgi:mono/diheme cytochrome c family protein